MPALRAMLQLRTSSSSNSGQSGGDNGNSSTGSGSNHVGEHQQHHPAAAAAAASGSAQQLQPSAPVSHSDDHPAGTLSTMTSFLHHHHHAANSSANKSNPPAKKSFQNLGLHSGAASGNLGLVKFALDQGQPIDSVVNGVLPIHAACCSNANVPVVLYLIERGADVNSQRWPRKYSGEKSRVGAQTVGTTGSTPLHFAAANGCLAIVEVLLRHGAIVDIKDKYGSSPLSVASARNHPDVASLLRQHSAMQRGILDTTPDAEVKDPFVSPRSSSDYHHRLSQILLPSAPSHSSNLPGASSTASVHSGSERGSTVSPTSPVSSVSSSRAGNRMVTLNSGHSKDTSTQSLPLPIPSPTFSSSSSHTPRNTSQRRVSLPSIIESPCSPVLPPPRQSCDLSRMPRSDEPLVASKEAEKQYQQLRAGSAPVAPHSSNLPTTSSMSPASSSSTSTTTSATRSAPEPPMTTPLSCASSSPSSSPSKAVTGPSFSSASKEPAIHRARASTTGVDLSSSTSSPKALPPISTSPQTNPLHRRRSMDSTELLSPQSAMAVHRRRSIDILSRYGNSNGAGISNGNAGTGRTTASKATQKERRSSDASSQQSQQSQQSQGSGSSPSDTSSFLNGCWTFSPSGSQQQQQPSPYQTQQRPLPELSDESGPLRKPSSSSRSGRGGRTGSHDSNRSQVRSNGGTDSGGPSTMTTPHLVRSSSQPRLELERDSDYDATSRAVSMDYRRQSLDLQRSSHLHNRAPPPSSPLARKESSVDGAEHRSGVRGQMPRHQTMQSAERPVKGNIAGLPRFHSMGHAAGAAAAAAVAAGLDGGDIEVLAPSRQGSSVEGQSHHQHMATNSSAPAPPRSSLGSQSRPHYATLSGHATVSGRLSRIWAYGMGKESHHGGNYHYGSSPSSNSSANSVKEGTTGAPTPPPGNWNVCDFAEASGEAAAQALVKPEGSARSRSSMLYRLSGMWSRR